MVIHHVEMDDVGAGGDDVFDFLAQAGKIGRQDAGSDTVAWHNHDLPKNPLFYPFGLR